MPRAQAAPAPIAVFAFAALAAVCAVVAIAPGCARKDGGSGSRALSSAAADSAREAAGMDTGRVGHTFVVTYDSGPVDRLRIVRDTAGRIVVEGASGFSDGTKVTVTLLRRIAGGGTEAASVTRAKVELGRFQTSPLIDEATSAPPPDGPVSILVSVSFAPGQQSEAVTRASADGHRFRGQGMKEAPGGYAVYEQRIEAPL